MMEGYEASEEEQYRAHVQFCSSLNSDGKAEALLGGLLSQVANPVAICLTLSKRVVVKLSKYGALPKIGAPSSSTPSETCKV